MGALALDSTKAGMAAVKARVTRLGEEEAKVRPAYARQGVDQPSVSSANWWRWSRCRFAVWKYSISLRWCRLISGGVSPQLHAHLRSIIRHTFDKR
jgi:hypothetical protein